jgi:hypothetical protein
MYPCTPPSSSELSKEIKNAPLPPRQSFPKRSRMRFEASRFDGSHWYKTNKLPCFIDKYMNSRNEPKGGIYFEECSMLQNLGDGPIKVAPSKK